jgi:hypothetical protein
MNGLLLTIGGMTLVKCKPSFEMPAPTQTTTISSFSAMIISTKLSVPNRISAGRYCSPRPARKTILSRSPITTSSTMGAISRAGLTSPDVLPGIALDSESLCTPGESSGMATLTINTMYRPTSNQVRRSPLVNGTHFQGRSRMVPGRAQNRMPPVIGLTLPASGPHDPATPISSRSTVHRTAFS